MAVLGLRFCVRAFCSCGKWGPLLITVRGPLTIAASPAAEHRLQTRRLSNCGSRAQSLRGTWDPPRPGLEPASPALAGRLSTTAPPGKPRAKYLMQQIQTILRGEKKQVCIEEQCVYWTIICIKRGNEIFKCSHIHTLTFILLQTSIYY